MSKRLNEWRRQLNGKPAKSDLDASVFTCCAIGERLGFPNGETTVKPYLTKEAYDLGMRFYMVKEPKARLAILRQIERLPKILVRGHPSELVDTFLVKSTK